MGVKKYLYVIFAATAATILMALIGVGSASASVLCDEPATKCTSYGKNSVLDAYLTEATSTLTTTGETLLDTCTSGVIEGKTSTAGSASETVKEPIERLTWGSCTHTTDTIAKGELEIHWISGTHNGTVTGKNISFTVNSSFGTCTYGTGEALDLGTLTGGSVGAIDVNATLVKTAGGFLCPSSAKWTVSYSIASPRPLYIGESSVAAAPSLDIQVKGEIEGSRTCVLGEEGAICPFTVTNNFGVDIKVMYEELFDAPGRYEIINEGCEVGTEIEPTKSCEAEVELKEDPKGKEWLEAYYIQAEERFSEGKVVVGAVGLLEGKAK